MMACAGDIPTLEALAATAMLREEFPDLKLRFVNVVDLFKLQPETEHPHGLSDRDFDSLFTVDKPIIFNFHGYPWLIHRLAYRRTNHQNLHVRGYKEKGNINTPLELAIENQIDRFSLAMDVIDRVPRLRGAGAHAKERFRNRQIECRLLRARARHRPAGDHRLALAGARGVRPQLPLEHVEDVVVRGERALPERAGLDALHDLLAGEIEDRLQDLRALLSGSPAPRRRARGRCAGCSGARGAAASGAP